ncbi:MAG: DinB family protein [Planctomycetota bacterium]
MIEVYRVAVSNQYEAALRTLSHAVEACPDEAWHAAIANRSCAQAVFHALFFADLYLDTDPESMQQQPFHREHATVFRDYEELEDRKPVHEYSKEFVVAYVEHVRTKAVQRLREATPGSLESPAPFQWVDMSRAELHVYNIRHLQHHAAQLILRLRLNGPIEFPWYKSGGLRP